MKIWFTTLTAALSITSGVSAQQVSTDQLQTQARDSVRETGIFDCSSCATDPTLVTKGELFSDQEQIFTNQTRTEIVNERVNTVDARVSSQESRLGLVEDSVTNPVDLDPIEARIAAQEAANTARVQDIAAVQTGVNDANSTSGQALAATAGNADRITNNTQLIGDLAGLAGIEIDQVAGIRDDINGNTDLIKANTQRIAAVSEESKRRDAAILAIPQLDFGMGDQFAGAVAIGSVGGEQAVGVTAGARAFINSTQLTFSGSAATDTGGNETALKGTVGLSF